MLNVKMFHHTKRNYSKPWYICYQSGIQQSSIAKAKLLKADGTEPGPETKDWEMQSNTLFPVSL